MAYTYSINVENLQTFVQMGHWSKVGGTCTRENN